MPRLCHISGTGKGSDVAGAKPSVEMGEPWENAKRIQIRAIVFIPISSGLNWFPSSHATLYPSGGEEGMRRFLGPSWDNDNKVSACFIYLLILGL